MKRERLLRKYKIETKENLDQVIEEFKKISAETQRLSRYKKRQKQY
jgi:ribosomal protein S21